MVAADHMAAAGTAAEHVAAACHQSEAGEDIDSATVAPTAAAGITHLQEAASTSTANPSTANTDTVSRRVSKVSIGVSAVSTGAAPPLHQAGSH